MLNSFKGSPKSVITRNFYFETIMDVTEKAGL